MSINYIGEQPGTSGRQDGKLTAERVFRYKIDDIRVNDPSDIILDSNIPATNSPHPTIAGLGANGVSLREANTSNPVDGITGNYDAVVSYQSSEDTGDLTDRTDTEPWNLPPFNISIGTRDIVVPQYKAYQEGDEQFKQSKPVVHPATQETLIVDTVEKHGVITFSYNIQKFDYDWKRKLENTVNLEAETIIGYRFPAKTLLLRKIGAVKKSYTTQAGAERDFWQVNIEIEDFGSEIKKEIALMGYLHIYTDPDQNELIKEIQLKDGVFGWFNNPELNITTPRWVDKTGQPLQKDDSVYSEFYENYPDKFEAAWNSLSMPTQES